MSDDKTNEEIVEDMLQEEISDAWLWLLSQPKGQIILWSILDKCGLFSFPFYGNSHDALHRGKQQVGSQILSDHVLPMGVEYYADMLVAAEERQKKLEAAIEQTDAKNQGEDNL